MVVRGRRSIRFEDAIDSEPFALESAWNESTLYFCGHIDRNRRDTALGWAAIDGDSAKGCCG